MNKRILLTLGILALMTSPAFAHGHNIPIPPGRDRVVTPHIPLNYVSSAKITVPANGNYGGLASTLSGHGYSITFQAGPNGTHVLFILFTAPPHTYFMLLPDQLRNFTNEYHVPSTGVQILTEVAI